MIRPEDPRSRARALLASLPEFEGTLEEAFEAHRRDEVASMDAKWTQRSGADNG